MRFKRIIYTLFKFISKVSSLLRIVVIPSMRKKERTEITSSHEIVRKTTTYVNQNIDEGKPTSSKEGKYDRFTNQGPSQPN